MKPPDRNVEGVVELMVDATRNYNQPLTPNDCSDGIPRSFPPDTAECGGSPPATVATAAKDRCRFFPTALGKERVHNEAPKAGRLDGQMYSFLGWFEGKDNIDAVLRAALAHPWFVPIHPSDDGKGRIAFAIADMALAHPEHSTQRFYSMSTQIRTEHKAYYDILESRQKGTMDVTLWMEWFLGCLGRAIDGAREVLSTVLDKARFWDRIRDIQVSERQRLVINRLLGGFEGKLTSSKYAVLAKCSQDPAHRDTWRLSHRAFSSEPRRRTQHQLFAQKHRRWTEATSSE